MADVVVQGEPVRPLVPPPPSPTKAYRLRAGQTHLHDGVSMTAGQVVFLTKAQAAAFVDKMEPTDDSAFAVHTPEEMQKTVQTQTQAPAEAALPTMVGNPPLGASPEFVQAQNALNAATKAQIEAEVKKQVDAAVAKATAEANAKVEETRKAHEAAVAKAASPTGAQVGAGTTGATGNKP